MKAKPNAYYSHGFENIYSYETIDPASVRTLKETKPTQKQPFEVLQEKEAGVIPTLNLFRSSTKLFREKEPLDSLQVSPFAMKALKAFSIETVGQLYDLLLHNKTALRSIGQSHLDELENKMKRFLSHAEEEGSYTVDMHSCIRLVLSKLPMKEKALIATLCHLKPYCFLPASEEKEADLVLRKLSKSSQEEFFQKMIPHMTNSLYEALAILSSSFLKPLLQKRGGIASTHTVEQALITASNVPTHGEMHLIQSFFQNILSVKEKPWFALPFEYIQPCFLSLSKEKALLGEEVLQLAQTFLDMTKTPPSLPELGRYIWRNQVKHWNPLDESTIEELLYWKYCPFTTNVRSSIVP